MLDSKKYAIKSGAFLFHFDENDLSSVDLVKRSANLIHLLANSRSVQARLISANESGKKMEIDIGGETFQVEISDPLDQVLDKMGFGEISAKQIKEIKAPMPGLVLQIAVSNGQEVKEGDKILILEAMKMENSIVIHTDAVIKNILIKEGQAVDKGQILVELE